MKFNIPGQQKFSFINNRFQAEKCIYMPVPT